MAKKSGKAPHTGRRPIWRGQIRFGLVQIPVVLHTAENRHDLQFRLLDSRNHARVRYERVNEETGAEVPWSEVVKAYEYDDKNYVVLTDADFKRAAVEATRSIEIEEFVDAKEIRPIYYDTPYYLVPDTHGAKTYALLREALRKTGKIGVARVVIRTREYLCIVYPDGPRALTLMLLRFQQELRELPEGELPAANLKSAGVTAKELDMAVALVGSMSGKWKPESFHDEYRDKLMKWIEKRAKSGGKMPAPEVEEDEEAAPAIINISDLLQKSLRSRGKSRNARARPHMPKRKRAG